MLPSIWRKNNSVRNHPVNDFFDSFFYGLPAFERETELKWSPRADINETEKEIILDFELPGIDKKDIKVEVKENRLSISGERKQVIETEKIEKTEKTEKTEKKGRNRIERQYGKYERTFTLPDTVKTDKISAKHKNGVLTLILPKAEKAIPKAIAVEVK